MTVVKLDSLTIGQLYALIKRVADEIEDRTGQVVTVKIEADDKS